MVTIHAGLERVVKCGFQSGRQRYKCLDCKKVFQPHKRTRRQDFVERLWSEYVWGKQTLVQLRNTLGKGVLRLASSTSSSHPTQYSW